MRRSPSPVKTFSTGAQSPEAAKRPCALCGNDEMAPLWDLGYFRFSSCPRCGLVQQNPQPLREGVLARYGESYLDYEVGNQFAYRDLELLALDDIGFPVLEAGLLARPEGGPAVLDVGCATGAFLASLKERGWRCVGVEVCPETAAYGKARFGLDIRVSTLEGAALPSESFDLVHASHLIEHLNEPRSFLEEAGRLIRPEGFLVLTTPAVDGFQAKALGKAWRSAISDHLYLFSKRTLKGLLESSGFRIEALSTWGGWAKGMRPAFIKAPLDRIVKPLGIGDVMVVLAKRA